jgi:transposase
MSISLSGSAPVIGIDVAKAQLAVAVLDPAASAASRPQPCEAFVCPTNVAGVGQLITRLAALAPALVVLEASGGYERPVVEALWSVAIPVALVNPRRVRWFAKSAGYSAKTDRLDAGVLAHFALVVRPAPQLAPPASLRRLRALVRRREQLVAVLATERQRAVQWARDDAAIHAACQALIATLETSVAAVQTEIDALLATDPELALRAGRLQSVPGVGRVVATTLLACLPELGLATDKEVAALAGLAPYSRESGQWTGERHISGGRAGVRRVLYLATISARRANPAIRVAYERLRAAGKPVKVALVACARKLLVVLNALARDGTTWVDHTVTP